jgi:8-oxo-dGTP diphosphatase
MINCSFENGNRASLRHVVVDNLVLQDDRILLVKRAPQLIEGGKWGLVGGFVDRDETIKQAAAREIMEETGYEVTDITLFRIVDTPNRPGEDRHRLRARLRRGPADGNARLGID